MKVHKLEIIVFDPNESYEDIDDVITEIENSLSNPTVHFVSTKTKEAGEWNDNCPLNFTAKRANNYFNKLK